MQIEPYLAFQGNCEAALNFYKDILGGEITMLSRFKDAPPDPRMTADWAEKVMHATFEAQGNRFMACDAPPHMGSQGFHGFSMSINLPDAVEGARVFNALAQGGTVTMPFGDMFWGAKFGMLTDQFGLGWMVNCDGAAGK